MSIETSIARDGEIFPVRANGVGWRAAWSPPADVPQGTPHGSCGFCVTGEREVVLISQDGTQWEWPGGRPEGDETWEATFRREMLEETCCAVGDARLLGFCRSECLDGPETGLVLVRSVWRGEVEVLPWDPQFEIGHRRMVAAEALMSALDIEPGWEPIYRRAVFEAGLG
ncbi:NUDIX domain-containing protein [Phenylobacterium sp.]|uniref:NUDIX hydrolase n=1 Tax=Phenylobacterium sp. TaxID=1871053 RepID=UPI0030F3ED58